MHIINPHHYILYIISFVIPQTLVDTHLMMKNHSRLIQTVLDFESHMVGMFAYILCDYVNVCVVDWTICCWVGY